MANDWRPMDRFTEGQNVPHFTAFGHSDEQPKERWVEREPDVTFSREDTQREYDQLTRREVNQWQFMRWCVQHGVITEGE